MFNCDPLETLLRAEGSDNEADELSSLYEAGSHMRPHTEFVPTHRDEAEPITHRFWVDHSSTNI